MPVLIAILGIIAAAGVWAWRIHMAREALDAAAGLTGDIVSAARRLGFRRRANVHPVESVDDPALAIAAIGIAFLDLASLPTAEQLRTLKAGLTEDLSISEARADELLIVGRWLVNECKTPNAAVTRLGKRLNALDQAGFEPLLSVLGRVSSGGDGTMSPRQRDALDEVARIFRLR